MDNRNNIIDCFRAMAVILVSFYHVYRHIDPHLYFLGVNLYNPILNGWMGVGIFFVISGYCMGMATKSMDAGGVTLPLYKSYLKKRFLRITIPYYIAITFWVVAINFFHILPKNANVYDVVTHAFYIHNLDVSTMYSISGVFWSLAVEMQFYLVLPCIMVVCRTGRSRVWLVALLFCVSLTIHLLYPGDIRLTWGLPSYLSIFVLGWVLYLKKEFFYKHLEGKFKLSALIFIYLAMMFVDPGILKANKFYELMVSSVFGFMMMSALSCSDSKSRKMSMGVGFISKIGRMSFSIYLYNYIYILFGFPSKDSYGVPLVLMIIFAGTAMYYLVEKPYESLRRKIPSVSGLTNKPSA